MKTLKEGLNILKGFAKEDIKAIKEGTFTFSKSMIRSFVIGAEVAAIYGSANPIFAASKKPKFNNGIFDKLYDGIASIYSDFVAISTLVAAVAAVIVFIFNILLSNGDAKEGKKRLLTILFGYLGINFIMLILEAAAKLAQ